MDIPYYAIMPLCHYTIIPLHNPGTIPRFNNLYMWLYVPDFPWRVGLSYLICRRFYEGAQAQAH